MLHAFITRNHQTFSVDFNLSQLNLQRARVFNSRVNIYSRFSKFSRKMTTLFETNKTKLRMRYGKCKKLRYLEYSLTRCRHIANLVRAALKKHARESVGTRISLDVRWRFVPPMLIHFLRPVFTLSGKKTYRLRRSRHKSTDAVRTRVIHVHAGVSEEGRKKTKQIKTSSSSSSRNAEKNKREFPKWTTTQSWVKNDVFEIAILYDKCIAILLRRERYGPILFYACNMYGTRSINIFRRARHQRCEKKTTINDEENALCGCAKYPNVCIGCERLEKAPQKKRKKKNLKKMRIWRVNGRIESDGKTIHLRTRVREDENVWSDGRRRNNIIRKRMSYDGGGEQKKKTHIRHP